jgi:hypothetical protein
MKSVIKVKSQIVIQCDEINKLVHDLNWKLTDPREIDGAARKVISAATVIKDLAYQLNLAETEEARS